MHWSILSRNVDLEPSKLLPEVSKTCLLSPPEVDIDSVICLSELSKTGTIWSSEVNKDSITWLPQISHGVYGKSAEEGISDIRRLSEMGCRLYGKSAKGDEFNPFCIEDDDNTVKDVEVIGICSDIEQTRRSTWQEAEAVNRIVKTFGNALQNSYIKVYSDNKNVKSILLNGCRKQGIHEISLDLNMLCDQNNTSICPE